jgi:hypothetical protein
MILAAPALAACEQSQWHLPRHPHRRLRLPISKMIADKEYAGGFAAVEAAEGRARLESEALKDEGTSIRLSMYQFAIWGSHEFQLWLLRFLGPNSLTLRPSEKVPAPT